MRTVLLLLALSSLLVGCSSKKEAVVEEIRVERKVVRPSYMQHEVKYSGETLGLISRWYTGRTDNWKLIAEVNPSIKPQRISLGDVILIPNRLVTNSDPLPRKAVRSASRPSSSPARVRNAEQTESSASSSVVEEMEAKPVGTAITEKASALDSPPSVEKEKLGEQAQPAKASSGSITSSREKLLDELLSQ